MILQKLTYRGTPPRTIEGHPLLRFGSVTFRDAEVESIKDPDNRFLSMNLSDATLYKAA